MMIFGRSLGDYFVFSEEFYTKRLVYVNNVTFELAD